MISVYIPAFAHLDQLVVDLNFASFAHARVSVPGQISPSRPIPDPKALKQAAKGTKPKKSPVFVTPPPRKPSDKNESGSSSARKSLSFGRDTVHTIEAENPAGGSTKNMKTAEADDILAKLKDSYFFSKPILSHMSLDSLDDQWKNRLWGKVYTLCPN